MAKTAKNENLRKQICLQAPFNLVEWLENQAKTERRSISSQAVYFLEKAMNEDAKKA